MSEEKEMICGNCVFFNLGREGILGKCHRRPPPSNKDYGGMGEIPTARKDYWCGEFKPKGEYKLAGEAKC